MTQRKGIMNFIINVLLIVLLLAAALWAFGLLEPIKFKIAVWLAEQGLL